MNIMKNISKILILFVIAFVLGGVFVRINRDFSMGSSDRDEKPQR